MRALALVGILLMISACSAGGVETSTRQAVPEALPTPDVVEAPPAEEIPEAPVVEEEKPDPAILNGMTPDSVQDLLGVPDLVRRDGQVQIMLFERSDCIMEVVFYEQQAGAYFRAENISAHDRYGAQYDLTACMAHILP